MSADPVTLATLPPARATRSPVPPAPLDTAALLAHLVLFTYRRQPWALGVGAPPSRLVRFEDRLLAGLHAFEQGAWQDAVDLLRPAAVETAPAHPDRDLAVFYLGLAHLRLGDLQPAFDRFLESFRSGQRVTAGLLEAACIATSQGDELTALRAFNLLITAAGNVSIVPSLLSMVELRLYVRALAAVAPRIARLLNPCTVFSPAAPTLALRSERVIGTLLDQTCDDLLAGRITKPVLAGRWSAEAVAGRRRRVMMIFAQHINCSADHVDNDVLHHLQASARERGHAVDVFHADRLLYGDGILPTPRLIDGAAYRPNPAGLALELARLQAAIEAFRPDLVMFEANFLPTETTLTPAFFEGVPSRSRFGLIAVVPDLYDKAPDFASAWTTEADHVLAFNEIGQHARRQRDAGRLLYFPNLPFMANPWRHGERPHDFVFVGGSHRGRDAVLARLDEHVPNNRIILTDRRTDSAFGSVDAFYAFLAQGRVTFNTGYIDDGLPGIQTGRTVEAMLSRTALLEESPAALSRAFVPFLHFVPMDRADQAVAYTQFLSTHPEHRTRLVDAALAFVDECYSPSHFWTQIESIA